MAFRRLVVVGLGYVGLTLALSYARRGLPTVGLDVDEAKVAALRRGESDLLEEDEGVPLTDILRDALGRGTFTATTSPAEAYAGADAAIICVGIPVANGEPDFTPLDAAFDALVRHLPKGATVLLRTTVVPGTSRSRLLPRFAEAGWTVGRDVFFAYCPERLAEGRAFPEIRTVPVPLAAEDEESRRRAEALLRVVLEAEIHRAERFEEAELVKVVENAQRDVNIAVAQETARLCEALGIDTFRVIELANTHPRVRMLEPGPGVGGFCIPNAYHYLRPVAEAEGVALPTFAAGRMTNDSVPSLLVEIGVGDVARRRLPNPKAAVLGLGMKDGSPDARLSPAVAVVEGLRRRGVAVAAYDPLVTGGPCQVGSLEEAVSGAHLLYALVRQPGLPYGELRWLRRLAPDALIIDAKGVYRGRAAEVAALGHRLWSL